MEKQEVPILKFSCLVHILQAWGYLHEWRLMLTSLCRQTNKVWNESKEMFENAGKEYKMVVSERFHLSPLYETKDIDIIAYFDYVIEEECLEYLVKRLFGCNVKELEKEKVSFRKKKWDEQWEVRIEFGRKREEIKEFEEETKGLHNEEDIKSCSYMKDTLEQPGTIKRIRINNEENVMLFSFDNTHEIVTQDDKPLREFLKSSNEDNQATKENLKRLISNCKIFMFYKNLKFCRNELNKKPTSNI